MHGPHNVKIMESEFAESVVEKKKKKVATVKGESKQFIDF